MRDARKPPSQGVETDESVAVGSESTGLTPRFVLGEILEAHPMMARDLAVLWDAPVEGLLPMGEFTPTWRGRVGDG